MSYIHQKSKYIQYPFTTRVILKVAEKLGVKTEVIDQKFGYLVLMRKGHCFEYFINNRLPLNSLVADRLARDKVYTYVILEKNGVNVPAGDYFFKPRFCSNRISITDQGQREALKYAQKIKYPVVVKPNNLSAGEDVYLVKSSSELKKRLKKLFAKDYIVIVQKPVYGREYRLLVLDGRIMIAYEKISQTFCKNMSRGALAVDQTNKVNTFYRRIAKQTCYLLNLRVGGIDIVAEDIMRPDQNYSILEVNSMAGLEYFYRMGGKKRVEEFYSEILKKIFCNKI